MTARSRTRRRPAVAFLLATAALALVGTIVVGVAPVASAHAVLVSSTPASGATVSKPPSTVSLTFDENVRAPAYVVVTGPGGRRVDNGPARILNATVTEQVEPTGPAGSYVVAYRIVSADGHPIEDQLTYTVAEGAQPVPAPTTPAANADDGGHAWHVLGGFAVVIAGAGALLYERLQRRRHPAESGAPR